MDMTPERRRELDEALNRLEVLDREIEEVSKQILGAGHQQRADLDTHLLDLSAARSDIMREAGIIEGVMDSATGENTMPGSKIHTYYKPPTSSN